MPKILSLLVALVVFSSAAVAITEISSLKQLSQEVDAKTLVVLDIDNTIFEPQQVRATDQWFSAMFEHARSSGYDYQEAVVKVLPFYIDAHAYTKVTLIETCGVSVINDLCKKSLAVIALSARSLPMIPHTKRQFKDLGIDFTRSNVGHVRTDFTLNDGPVKFIDGVTYCGNNDKGETLLCVLDRLNLDPQKIVFVDDKEKNLKCVERSVARRKIPFIGKRFAACDAKVKAFVLDEKSKALIHQKEKVTPLTSTFCHVDRAQFNCRHLIKT
jgi:FMN phosphatase YigB (HAD superfamily)